MPAKPLKTNGIELKTRIAVGVCDNQSLAARKLLILKTERCWSGRSGMLANSFRPRVYGPALQEVTRHPLAAPGANTRITKPEHAPGRDEITDRIDDIDREIQLITSFTMDQMSPIEYAKNVHVPTFITQVHDDALTKPSDVQQIFDNIPVKDKKLFWIEGTTRRWDGYNYFPDHPEQMIEWFDTHMGVAERAVAATEKRVPAVTR